MMLHSAPPTPPGSAPHSLLRDLARLRDQVPDCRVAAYCDLETRLVLRHVSAPGIRQETLDRLSAEAQQGFALRQAAQEALPMAYPPISTEAEDIRLIDDGGVRLFLRSPDAPQDALLLLCASTESAMRLRPEAIALLHRLQGETPGPGPA
ncbi:hypothetical protein [Phaeobacter sp. HF9A]|uniref:hypothetical protein n=1 Tax=Phaeobacter sp. HF9A TaxID=2721561 RepID=UPI001431E5B1|nr:hypothetical protein [Phaeobacter sp. HF9A]NIZ15520.1 hypothetical protein [Phaeobacter sp. HF9A]